jgi:hypothetical protein
MKGRRGRGTTLAVIAGAVLIMLFVVAVGVVVLRSHATSSPAATRPGSTRPTAPPPAATTVDVDALALQLVVQPQDLSSDWTSVQRSAYTPAELNAPPICLTGTPRGNSTAGALTEYSRDLQPNGLESGHLTSAVFLQASAHDADVTRARLETPGFDACLQADVVAQLAGGGASNVTVAASSPLPGVPPYAGVAERLSMTFTVDNAAHRGIADAVDVVQGRVEFKLIVFQCSCGPLDGGLENTVTQTVSSRIRASAYAN